MQMLEDQQIITELREVVKGLTYPSESDEPFDVFLWPMKEADPLKQIATQGNKIQPNAETSLDAFFAELLTGDDAEKFSRLRDTLQSRLSNIRVFRVGQIEVNVYVIGITPADNWAGVHTVSVET